MRKFHQTLWSLKIVIYKSVLYRWSFNLIGNKVAVFNLNLKYLLIIYIINVNHNSGKNYHLFQKLVILMKTKKK